MANALVWVKHIDPGSFEDAGLAVTEHFAADRANEFFAGSSIARAAK